MKGFVTFQTDGGGWIGLNVCNIAYYGAGYSSNTTSISTTDGNTHIVKNSFNAVERAIESAMVDVSINNRSKELSSSDVTANVWIPVENGLPDSRTDVRIAYIDEFNGRICTNCIAHVDKGRWYNSFTLDLVECKVTHWKSISNDFVPGGAR